MSFDCKHRRTVLITAGHAMGSGVSERERVDVCRDCGEFRVLAEKSGARFDLSFSLYHNASLIAASQAIARLSRGEPAEKLTKRIWKPIDFAGLRLYEVRLSWCLKNGKQGTQTYIVAADSPNQTPSSAANLIKRIYAESYDSNPHMSWWNVSGSPLNVLQPSEWRENGVVLLNNQLVEAVRRFLEGDESAKEEMRRLVEAKPE